MTQNKIKKTKNCSSGEIKGLKKKKEKKIKKYKKARMKERKHFNVYGRKKKVYRK